MLATKQRVGFLSFSQTLAMMPAGVEEAVKRARSRADWTRLGVWAWPRQGSACGQGGALSDQS